MKSLFFLLLIPVFSFAQSSYFDFLKEKNVSKIDLIADFQELTSSKKQDIKVDALAIFFGENDFLFSKSVSLELRGKFRRKVCDFPPLKFRFDKKDLTTANYLPYNEWKLVTHCTNDIKQAITYLKKEQLIYQLLYSLDTGFFETRWIEILYKDIHPQIKSFVAPSFIIEDKEEMALRNYSKVCDCPGSIFSEFDQNNLVMVSLFQFLIGNSDWDISMLRNVEVIIDAEGQKKLIPYDFDYSGFVNPSYGLPNMDFKLKSMRDRVYLGPELSGGDLKTYLERFLAIWPSWENIILNTSQLNKKDKEELLDYLKNGLNFLKEKNHLLNGSIMSYTP